MSESTSAMPARPTVSVIVPAYSEARTMGDVLSRVLALPFVLEVIVVDDGSTDETADIVRKLSGPTLKLMQLSRNRGRTAAVSRALREVSGDVVVIQDADLEYDPAELSQVLAPIFEGHADVVYGSRFLVRRAARVLYFTHYFANRALTASNLFTNLNMTDIETGYKAFRTEIVKTLPLTSSGFGLEVEITASIAALPLRIYEVPISYYGRTYQEGKKIGLKDAVSAMFYLLYYNTLERRSRTRRSYRARVITALAAVDSASSRSCSHGVRVSNLAQSSPREHLGR